MYSRRKTIKAMPLCRLKPATCLALCLACTLPLLHLRAESQSVSLPGDRAATAVPIDEELIRIDGELNEPEWSLPEPARDFVQGEPNQGEPATEPTEVRLLYDRNNLYIGVRCFDSRGRKGILVNNMRKDFSSRDGDVFQVIMDTFDDDRNGFVFSTNPRGARSDAQIGGDGSSYGRDWDGIWYVKTKISESGWQAELAIPFKTLRFAGNGAQTWGINFARGVRRKNEESFWAPIPRPYRIYRISMAGELQGIDGIQGGRNLYIKPYVTAPLLRRENDDVDFVPDAGLDVKYGLTSQMTLDLTVNTDFSQVEADEQQINLTRFSLFFPEKREFFLENAELFELGRSGFIGTSPLTGRRNRRVLDQSRNRDLIPFFSRRIGIADDRLVPILGGARVTGRIGKNRTGFLSLQADGFEEVPSTNFTVARYRREVRGNSDIGAIFINKQAAENLYNRTYGVDANFLLFGNLDLSSYILKTDTPGAEGKDMAGNIRMAWTDQLLDIRASHLSIQDNFNAEVGFVPRTGIRKSRGEFALTPRPGESIPWIREFRPSISQTYIASQEGVVATKELEERFTVLFADSSFLSLFHRSFFDRLDESATILGAQVLPGDYQFGEYAAAYSTDPSRAVSGFARWSTGTLYHGERKAYLMGMQVQPNAQFRMEVSWYHNDLNIPTESLETDLVTTRLSYSFNTNMFLNALIQYNSEEGEIASNIRFNLIHRPLSDLFLVYNERRLSTGEVAERAFIAKLTYLFDF